MKFKVNDLTGQLVDNGPIEIDGHDLYQQGQRIGSIDDEGMNYLIKNRKDLQILKFVDERVNQKNELEAVNLFVSLKPTVYDQNKIKKFSWVKTIYYGVVIVTSLISLILSVFYQTNLWVVLFFGLVLFSSSFLLYDYLKSIGYLERKSHNGK